MYVFPFSSRKKGKKSQLIYRYKQVSLVYNEDFQSPASRKKEKQIYFTNAFKFFVFFNGYRAIGLACTKYQRLKEISMKEERPGQGPRRAATKADGVPHSRSQNEVTSSLTRTFGDATDPAWFTCRGQCYGYESIKI